MKIKKLLGLASWIAAIVMLGIGASALTFEAIFSQEQIKEMNTFLFFLVFLSD